MIRNGQEVNFPVEISGEGRLGFVPYGLRHQQMDSLGWLKLNVTRYGFLAAFPAGVRKTGTELKFYIDQFKKDSEP